MEVTPPPSPSIFLNLPPTPSDMLKEKDSSAHHDNDLVLPYIARMLMEEEEQEDIAGRLLYQQYDLDDPALLKAQQPFLEIISNNTSVPSRSCNTSVELYGQPVPHISAVAPSIGTESMVDTISLLPAEGSCMEEVSMAFSRGMEEANKFLPSIVINRDRDRDSGSEAAINGTSRKKKHESEEETGGDITPPSPSVFHDLPPASCRSSAHQDNDLVLPYISRMLMEEEDIADKLLYQQYDLNDPALLEAQQPFLEIISNNAGVPSLSCSTSVELSGQPLPDTSVVAPSIGTESILLPAESSCMDEVSMAFFRGMEEANNFLPSIADGSSRKKKHESEETTSGDMGHSRSRKQMAAPLPPESEEEATAREMLDRLMLDGYDPNLGSDMHELHHVAMTKEQTMTSRRLGRRNNGSSTKDAVDMHGLLIRCAEALSTNDWRNAVGLLEQIKDHSSPTGDATQRLASCIAKGLESRLAGTGSQVYLSLGAKCASMVGILKTLQLSITSCCFLPVQLLFSNKSIYKAVAGRKKLHIVEYGLGHGIQWPDLLRWLSRREGGPPEVRLTGIDMPQPGFRPAWRIEETGRRLSAYARQFGVPFDFRGIANKSEAIQVEDLNIDPDEVLAVSSMFHLESLMDDTIAVDMPNPRDVVLGTITKMRPSVFIHAIANGSHSSAFFMARFRDALQRYSALFDMMDAVCPRDDDRRLLVEQDMFARCATSLIACEGVERLDRPQNYKQWQSLNQRAGLRQLPLDPQIVEVLEHKVKKEYHKCFVISNDQQWLLQGWKGRMLFAISAWTADDP